MRREEPITQLLTALSQVILGKPLQLKIALVTLLARGHLLIEDLPGMGKTTLAQALAQVLGLACRRMQFTADLLPADLLGLQIFDPQQQTFRFHPGPIFTQVLLADEINRASPKVQSALLEAMAEGKVSIEGHTHPLPPPSSSSPPRIRRIRRAPIHCRSPSSTASPCDSLWVFRRERRSASCCGATSRATLYRRS